MNSFIKKAVDIIKSNLNAGKKDEPDLTTAFDTMDKELEEAEKAYGKPLFPDDKKITMEDVYFANLELPNTATFEEIKESYKTLLKKYNPDRFQNEEKKLKAAEKITEKLNAAFNYFEQKFNSDI